MSLIELSWTAKKGGKFDLLFDAFKFFYFVKNTKEKPEVMNVQSLHPAYYCRVQEG